MVDRHSVPLLTQKLLIAWGKDGDQAIHNDIWLLEIDRNDYSSLKWRKVGISIQCDYVRMRKCVYVYTH